MAARLELSIGGSRKEKLSRLHILEKGFVICNTEKREKERT